MSERVLEDGALAWRADDPAEAAFRVRSGALLITPPGADSNILRLVLPGEIFGAELLVGGATYGANARACGRTVLEVVGWEEILSMLGRRADLAETLVRAAIEGQPPAAPAVPGIAAVAPRLILADAPASARAGGEGVAVTSFPFVVGRNVAAPKGHSVRAIDLPLDDRRPYSLSRRHFAILREGGRYVVRDCGSYHGTIVNGTAIGLAGRRALMAPLAGGENEIVAGGAASPFRFQFRAG